MNRYIFAIVSFLFSSIESGCTTQVEERFLLEEEIKTTGKKCLESERLEEEISSVPSIFFNLNGVENKEKLIQDKNQYDLDSAIYIIVNRMARDVNSTGILVIDTINNFTSNSLDFSKATETLYNAVEETGIFTLVSKRQLTIARKKLGLHPKDKLNTTSKSIGIANSVGAHYVLYPSVKSNLDKLILQVQLILVQTGEIIWSDTITVQ